MSNRENTLAVLLVALIFLGGGGLFGYMLILDPLWEKEKTAAALQKDVVDLEAKVVKLRDDTKRLAVANKRSLPTDQILATREYSDMLERLVRQAYGDVNPPGFKITEKKVNEVRTASVPGQPAKKPAFTRIAVEVEFHKADAWIVHDFLAAYYQLNLLQQITGMSIKREDEGAAAKKGGNAAPDRKDLIVKVTTEALILEGADPRRTLLPVSPAFAAVGGYAGYATIALTPEASRGITPTQFVPVLATRPRDYTLIVRKDPFHGPYVDPKAPVAKAPPKPPEKEDISNSIILGGVVPASDRTAYATIRDSYNPFNYVIEATPKGITVQKFYFVGKNKKAEPPNKDSVLVISDENVSLTNRTFKIVEVDVDGLILLDLTPSARSEAKSDGKGSRSEAPMPRPGGPGPKGPGGSRPAAPAVSAPLAGVVGAAAATAGPPGSRLYRWAAGKPLKQLTEIPPAEAKLILERAAAEGPVRRMAAVQ
jgi:hypothetical protein